MRERKAEAMIGVIWRFIVLWLTLTVILVVFGAVGVIEVTAAAVAAFAAAVVWGRLPLR